MLAGKSDRAHEHTASTFTASLGTAFAIASSASCGSVCAGLDVLLTGLATTIVPAQPANSD